MNKLVIIGNGFDLAHGMKTRYQDFILWYFNSIVEILMKQDSYEDILIKINYRVNISLEWPNYFNTVNEIIDFIKEKRDIFDFRIKCSMLHILIRKNEVYNWIDIEYEYYSYLKRLYEMYEELDKSNIEQVKNNIRQVEHHNQQFEYIKSKLQEYLIYIESLGYEENAEIRNIIKNIINPSARSSKTLIINFNYTSTIEKYIDNFPNDQVSLNYIHGKLNDYENPIIFGYGDEIDSYYEKIENINVNEYLKNFKSFNYLYTNNYQTLSRFIDASAYTVHILGHSCGLSDRVLFKQIVEHRLCRKIHLYYYQKNQIENDFSDKTYELSRHFSLENKGMIRTKIETFPSSKPLVKWKKVEV